ncbi:MAG: DegV family protein [Lachnospiraceae bacterium]|nr:DegV family protein [Lachnospiraceae bacterium]
MFQIIVDSAANIPADLVKKFRIIVKSFINYVDGKEVVCFDPDLTQEEEREKGREYYDAIKAGAEVKTSLINSETFEEIFRNVLEKDEDVIYISLSSNISGTFNAARIACEEIMQNPPNDRKIYLVDSMNASLGQGLLAIYASEMRDKGMDVQEVYNEISSYVPRINGVFTVDDLKHLTKTGRLSNPAAYIGNLLGIKPILKGNKDGYIVQFKKCRGRKSSLNELVDLVCNNATDTENQIFGIAHANNYEDSLYVMNEIKKRVTFRDYINTSYDFCTGSHVGPDTIAVFFLAKDRELEGKGTN